MNEKLSISAGLRTDANSYSSEMSNPLQQLSPRISLSYQLTEKVAFNFNSSLILLLYLSPDVLLPKREISKAGLSPSFS